MKKNINQNNMKKKINPNNWKEIYKKCNHNMYSQLTNVQGKTEVKSNIKNLLNNYKMVIIISLVILLAIFIYAFKNNPIAILYSIGFIFLILLFMIYSSTYNLKLDENKLTLKMNFQTTTIDTNDLANIYLSRDKTNFFWIPVYAYLLNIIYIVNEKPEIISLPIVMADKKSIKKLFSNIETEKIKDEEEEIENKKKNNKIVILTIIIVSIIVLFVVSLILGIMYKNGNIQLNSLNDI